MDPALQLPERHPADGRLRVPAGDRAPRAARSPGCWWSGTAQSESYSADVVVVSAGAINSAALLLRSVSDQHPRGLANGSDVVGRHYMGHVNSVLMALSKCPNPTVFQKTPRVNDFYFGSPEWEYPMGHISFVGKLDGATLSAGAPAIAPGWTLDLMGKHSLDFWLTSEDLPDPDNRVTLDREGKIVLSYTPNNGEAHRRLVQKLEQPDAAADPLPGARATTATRASSPATCSSASGFRWPAWRTRTAPFASGTTRRRRRSTRTAGRTRWTTSTSSTAASSPRAAR